MSLAWSKNVFRARIKVILPIHSAVWVWLWLCALDDLLLLPVLSVILKMYKYRCLYSCLVILPFSISIIQKCHICEVYIFASQAYNAGSCKTSVRWIQSSHVKPEVDIMIYSVASESPMGLLQCHKNNCFFSLLTRRFSAETALGDHFTHPPAVAVKRVYCFMNPPVHADEQLHTLCVAAAQLYVVIAEIIVNSYSLKLLWCTNYDTALLLSIAAVQAFTWAPAGMSKARSLPRQKKAKIVNYVTLYPNKLPYVRMWQSASKGK